MDKESQDHLNAMALNKQKELLQKLGVIYNTIEEYLKSKDGYSKSVIITLNNMVPDVTKLQTEIDLIKRIN